MPSTNPSNRLKPDRGRGTSINPPNRFEPVHFVQDDEHEADQSTPGTVYLRDDSGTILTSNNSPDIPFAFSINPYRGCEHGCVYCYARPTHEYLGFSAGSDFESKIMVKENAPELLRRKLMSPSWKPQPIIMSGITDPYQPVEKRLRLTRRCLETLWEFRNPVSIITKNHLVTRDIDILSKMAEKRLVRVAVSITSLDPDLTSILEPRTSRPQRRLEAIRKLSEAGIETAVMTAPVIPALNDHEIPEILKLASEAGAVHAGYVMLRLPWAVKDIFVDWLGHHFPDRKSKILARITDLRGGQLNVSNFGERMSGTGRYAEQVREMFRVSTARHGLNKSKEPLNTALFRRRAYGQADLFETD